MPHLTLPPEVAVIGGGPAGLMAAERLARGGAAVTVYDRMPSLGRKLLMAGRGGLNLTHGEPLEAFLGRYGEARALLAPILGRFTPQDLRAWCEGLGQETFVGSSGRVFPKAFKASPLLRSWLRRLEALGVRVRLRHALADVAPDGVTLRGPAGEVRLSPAATVLALGGASWPRLGADGSYAPLLERHGVRIAPLRPANMAVRIGWSEHLRERFAGEPLKRIALTAGGRTVRGEAVVTRGGLEGGAVYALSGLLRDAILREGLAQLLVDLRPDLSAEALAGRLAAPRKGQSLSTALRKAAGLAPVAVALLREASPALPEDPAALAALVKSVPLVATGVEPLDRAISTAGGIALAEVDGDLMLRRLPGVFVAGEMLDWEAPTGGYLLQACFATGLVAGEGALRWARDRLTAPTRVSH